VRLHEGGGWVLEERKTSQGKVKGVLTLGRKRGPILSSPGGKSISGLMGGEFCHREGLFFRNIEKALQIGRA